MQDDTLGDPKFSTSRVNAFLREYPDFFTNTATRDAFYERYKTYAVKYLDRARYLNNEQRWACCCALPDIDALEDYDVLSQAEYGPVYMGCCIPVLFSLLPPICLITNGIAACVFCCSCCDNYNILMPQCCIYQAAFTHSSNRLFAEAWDGAFMKMVSDPTDIVSRNRQTMNMVRAMTNGAGGRAARRAGAAMLAQEYQLSMAAAQQGRNAPPPLAMTTTTAANVSAQNTNEGMVESGAGYAYPQPVVASSVYPSAVAGAPGGAAMSASLDSGDSDSTTVVVARRLARELFQHPYVTSPPPGTGAVAVSKSEVERIVAELLTAPSMSPLVQLMESSPTLRMQCPQRVAGKAAACVFEGASSLRSELRDLLSIEQEYGLKDMIPPV